MALDTLEIARQEIAKIYFAAFNRAAEPDGLQNWLNQYTAGLMDYSKISENFSVQPEYTTTYPATQTSLEYITMIYQNVFGRAADEGGLQNWINQLDNPNITGFNKGNIMSAMLDAAGSAGNTDGIRLDNKAAVNISLVDNGTTDATFMQKALAAVTADASTVDIVKSVITMVKADPASLTNANATLDSVQAILTDAGSAATLTTTLANLKTVMQTTAANVTAGTVTDVAATLKAATSTVKAATKDASFVADPAKVASNITADPVKADSDAGVVAEETAPVTPPASSSGGGGSSTPATTFTASVDENGTITFSGTATGDITMNGGDSRDGDTQDVTFTRGGITTNTVTLDINSEISVASGQTFVNTATQADGATIEGAGTVNITGLEDVLSADLSGITATTVTATIDTTPADGADGIGSSNNFGSAAVTVTGTGSLVFSETAVLSSASFIVGENATLSGTSSQISGLDITGTGNVEMLVLATDTNLTTFASTLYITGTAAASTTLNISANENLANLDHIYVDTDGSLTLNANQSDGILVTGPGSATLVGSEGNQSISIYTLGTNSITGGLGLDTITLGIDESDSFTGIDTIVIGAGGTDTASDSAPGYDNVPHTIDTINNFDIANDKLDLANGATLLTAQTYTIDYGSGVTSSIVVLGGMVTSWIPGTGISTTGDMLISELYAALGDTTHTVAFYETGFTSGNLYVLQGNSVASGQISDIAVKLTNVTTGLADLSTILVPKAIGAAATLAANSASAVGATDNVVITGDVAATVAELKAINDKTSGTITLNAATIAANLSGSADDLKAAFDGITSHTGTIGITGTTSAADANTIMGATSGVVTATVTATGAVADLNAALTNATANDALTMTLDATTASAADLNTLDGKTSVNVNAGSITGITSSAVADVKTLVTNAAAAGIDVDWNVVLSDTSISAADAKAVNAGTSGTIDMSLATTITSSSVSDVLEIVNNTNATFTTVDNYAVTLSDTTIAAADIATINTDNGTGAINIVLANTISSSTVENVLKIVNNTDSAFTTATDYAVTLSDNGSVAAADLKAIDEDTTGLVTATSVTTLTGTKENVGAILTQLGTTGDKINLGTIADGVTNVAVTISDEISVADVNLIDAVTSGVVTASLTTGDLASFSTLSGTGNAYTVTVNDATDTAVTATDLSALGAKTTADVTVSNAVVISGTTEEVTAALVTAESKVLAATAVVTLTDNALTYIDATALSAIGGATSGTVTASNPIVITGTIDEITAALVTSETSVVAETALIHISSAAASTNLNAVTINAIDAKATGTLEITLSDKILATTLDDVTFDNTVNSTEIILADVADNAITLVDATVANGGRLIINSLSSSHSLTFNGSAESNGHLLVHGGSASDTIVGGAAGNTITGGGGADIITGGTGVDLIFLTGATYQSGFSTETGTTAGTAVTFNEGTVGESIKSWTSGQDKLYFNSSVTTNAIGEESDTLKVINKSGVVANTDRYVHITDTANSDNVDTGAGAVAVLNALDTSAVAIGDSFIVAMDNDTSMFLYYVKQISEANTIAQQDVTLIGVINSVTTITDGDFVSN